MLVASYIIVYFINILVFIFKALLTHFVLIIILI